MRVWKLITSSVLVTFLTAGVILPALARAQAIPDQGFSLQISPLPIEINAAPGKAVTNELRVRNAGSQTEKLAIHLLKVTEDNNGIVHLTTPGPGDVWSSWVSFNKTVFDAPSNQWQTIEMTIKLPKSAAFGYYFAVEYTRASNQAPQPGQAVAHGAVATFILLNAEAPGAIRQANVASFSASQKTYEFLPADFTVKVHAAGNVHVAPHGNIFITKGNKQIGSVAINQAEGNVLPNSSRFFTAGWNDGFPAYVNKTNNGQPVLKKDGQPARSLKWDFSQANHLRFGHYTANLVMVYDNGSRDVPITASLSFWVIPWRLIAILLVIVILAILGVWTLLRRTGRFVGKHSKRVRKKPGGNENQF